MYQLSDSYAYCLDNIEIMNKKIFFVLSWTAWKFLISLQLGVFCADCQPLTKFGGTYFVNLVILRVNRGQFKFNYWAYEGWIASWGNLAGFGWVEVRFNQVELNYVGLGFVQSDLARLCLIVLDLATLELVW